MSMRQPRPPFVLLSSDIASILSPNAYIGRHCTSELAFSKRRRRKGTKVSGYIRTERAHVLQQKAIDSTSRDQR